VDLYAYRAIAALILLSLTMVGMGITSRNSGQSGGLNILPFSPPSVTISEDALSSDERRFLLSLTEKMKMVQDLYIVLDRRWRLTMFSAMRRGEQKGMERLSGLVNHYGLTHPTSGRLLGSFGDPAIAKLYGELVKMGMVSRSEAIRAGGFIEEMMVRDFGAAAQGSQHPDLKGSFLDLQRSARNHLRYHAGAMELLGRIYRAQYLSSVEVTAIIASPLESTTPTPNP
ncbi:MAG: DUF2202 domain-containing protein, partial [Magnetococcales bacterium]|nr:DUF2202 domain-containing protein [Magnetococcales bacterium]